MLATSPRTAGAATFKQGMRALVGGVTVIATQDAMGVYLGLTATSVTSLSADPPSLLVCVNRSSPMAEALLAGVHFSANVLSEDQVDVAQAFGGQRTVRGMGRFAYGSWFRSTHDVPLLGGARVSFECVAAEFDGLGDPPGRHRPRLRCPFHPSGSPASRLPRRPLYDS